MGRTKVYEDLDGGYIVLANLDAEEQALVAKLVRRAKKHPDWNDFDNYWIKKVAQFYESRGLSRKQTTRTDVWKIAQDLTGRIGIASGMMRQPDYRDDLANLSRTVFKTRREFCEATGLGEDMLSHVFAGRKHLAIDTLMKALDRIGFMLRVMQKPQIEVEAAIKTGRPVRGPRKRSSSRNGKDDSHGPARRTPSKVA